MELLPADSAARPEVSVVIRARNEAAHIGLCLDALVAQDSPGPAEVVIVDSGSTDGTLEIARRYPTRIIAIRPEEFTYASALNRGLMAARAPVAALLSAHAVPVDSGWLSALLKALEDSRVAAAYSREVPWPNADLYERLRLKADFPPLRVVKALDLAREPGDHDALCLYTFSNAAAVLRRSLWEARPFRELPYAEDLDWARWAILDGHSIVYEPTARVRHSHQERVGARAAREVKSQLARAQIFALHPSLCGELLRNLKSCVLFAMEARKAPIPCAEKCYWALYALRKWLAFTRGWVASSRRSRCASS